MSGDTDDARNSIFHAMSADPERRSSSLEALELLEHLKNVDSQVQDGFWVQLSKFRKTFLVYIAPWTMCALMVGNYNYYFMTIRGKEYQDRDKQVQDPLFMFITMERLDDLNTFSWPVLAGAGPGVSIVGTCLSLILVFRSNMSYQRWWEARGMLGGVVWSLRNLACHLAPIPCSTAAQCEVRDSVYRHLISYFPLLVLSLRPDSKPNLESTPLKHSEREALLKSQLVPVLQIHAWVVAGFEELRRQEFLSEGQFIRISTINSELLTFAEGAIKVADTEVPSLYKIILWTGLICYACIMVPAYLAYAYHMKLKPEHISLEYTLNLPTLPFSFNLILIVACFCLFGIQAIAVELTNPYGRDTYDLPVDKMDRTIKSELAHLFHDELNKTLQFGFIPKMKRSAARAKERIAKRRSSNDVEAAQRAAAAAAAAAAASAAATTSAGPTCASQVGDGQEEPLAFSYEDWISKRANAPSTTTGQGSGANQSMGQLTLC